MALSHGVLLLALLSSWPRGSQETVGQPGIQAIVTKKGMDYCEYENHKDQFVFCSMKGEGTELWDRGKWEGESEIRSMHAKMGGSRVGWKTGDGRVEWKIGDGGARVEGEKLDCDPMTA